TYFEMIWQPVVDQVKTFTDECDILPGLKMYHTGGHSDGHSIVIFEDRDEGFIHMADIMPTHAHSNSLWGLAYDDYQMTSMFKKGKVKEEVKRIRYEYK